MKKFYLLLFAITVLHAMEKNHQNRADGRAPLMAALVEHKPIALKVWRILGKPDVPSLKFIYALPLAQIQKEKIETLNAPQEVKNYLKEIKDEMGYALLGILSSELTKTTKENAILLISTGATLTLKDVHGLTALLKAIQLNSQELVTLLLKHGADVNDRFPLFQDTALIYAILNGKKEIAELLINAGADLNAHNSTKDTALTIAAFSGYPDIVEQLIEKKVDLNHKNRYGYTSLIRATRKNYDQIVKLLINAGADLILEDESGKTAQFYARGLSAELLRNSLEAKKKSYFEQMLQ